MMRTGVVKDSRFADHDMGPFHVESPRRIEAIIRMVEKEISFPYLLVEPRSAREEEVEWIHERAYLDLLKATAGKEATPLDPDTAAGPLTYWTALLAAGGLLEATDRIMEGQIQNAFALVRPPGHHAEACRAMGFCFINNVAVAAEALVRRHGLKRILIVDWDLHHGNGTQNAFFERDDVLYFSVHQAPFYPGSGGVGDVGHGQGEGFTVNVPLLAGKGDDEYIAVFQEILSPIADLYRPEFVLCSAGYDICAGDPLGGMRVTSEGCGHLARQLIDLAEKHARGRLALTLEGGYNLEALTRSVKETLIRLSEDLEKAPSAPVPARSSFRELESCLRLQRRYWRI